MTNITEAIASKLRNDPDFRGFFPDLSVKLSAFLKDPDCPCNKDVVEEVARRLTGTRNTNRWTVIDCAISELAGEICRVASFGSYSIALAIDGDRCVCVINEKG